MALNNITSTCLSGDKFQEKLLIDTNTKQNQN